VEAPFEATKEKDFQQSSAKHSVLNDASSPTRTNIQADEF